MTKEFSQNVRQAGQELNTWQDGLEKANKEIKEELADGDITDERRADLINILNKNNTSIDNIDDYKLVLNTISMALTAPTDSIAGIAAAAATPKVAYEIGQYFKNQAEINKLTGVNNGELTEGQKLAHVAAHAVLGAAVAAIGGNDALTAGLAAGGAEAAVPVISNWLYQTDDPEKLTAEQKSTLTAIAGLIGTGVGLSTGGSVIDMASGSQLAQNAVDNNFLTKNQVNQVKIKLSICKAKNKGECSGAEYEAIMDDALKQSSRNIGLVQKYILEGNVEAVNALLAQAASSSDVNSIIIGGYDNNYLGLKRRADNVKIFESTKGMYTLFGSDADQAKESKEFRAAHCSGLTATQCNTLTKSAWDVQYAKYYAVMAASILTSGVRPSSVPRLAKLPDTIVNSLKNKMVKPAPAKSNELAGTISNGRTGTVWDNITPTQELRPLSNIPTSFELKVNGQNFWVHPNGTKHLVEYSQGAARSQSHGRKMTEQQLLTSMHAAVAEAIKNGYQYNVPIKVGNWELIFSPPRQSGKMTVIKHAQFNP